MTMWMFWLVLAAALVVVEIFTVSFYALWLGIASAAAAIVAALWPGMIWLQILIAALISLVLVPLTPALTRKWNRRSPGYKDERLNPAGKTAVVVQEIGPNRPGIVKVTGIGDWTATTSGPGTLPAGTTVVVEAVNGTILTVKPAREPAHEPTREPAHEPAHEPAREPARKTAHEHADAGQQTTSAAE